MTTQRIELPPKLIPVFAGQADVRGAHGGRGSGKTRTFAKMTAVRAFMWDQQKRDGIITCTRQFMASLDDSSMAEVKAAIRSEPWLEPHFDIGEKYIRTKSGRIEYKFAGLDRNIMSLKSTARILLNWTDEAEPVTELAWETLIPTLRENDSELWLTWNPARERSATNQRFYNSTNPRHKIVELNWRDNPWFPEILERKRLEDQQDRPDQYGHIWEGEFRTSFVGAYYAEGLRFARLEGRIGNVAKDPLMSVKAFWDIGGTGAKADATAIWLVQFIGREIRVLDYYEAQGQPMASHVEWLRAHGYDKAEMVLPHDGSSHDKVYQTSYEGALRGAGFSVRIVPNQGAGAAMARIETTRRMFPRIWFNEPKTKAGITAIGQYHEKRDDDRGIGLGPNHDWSSHAADAFGMMCISYDEPRVLKDKKTYQSKSTGGISWMTA